MRNDCAKCAGTGYLDQGRPYRPAYILRADGSIDTEAFDTLIEDPVFLFERTTIRYHELEPLFFPKQPEWLLIEPEMRGLIADIVNKHASRLAVSARAPKKRKTISPSANDGEEQQSQQLSRRRRVTYRVGESDLDVTTSSEIANIKLGSAYIPFQVFREDTAPHLAISNFINTYFRNGNTGKAHNFREICISLNRKILIAKSDSRWCANVQREHNSNTVYFMGDGRYVWQKCWSKKGTCPQFPPSRNVAPNFRRELPKSIRKKYFQLYSRDPTPPSHQPVIDYKSTSSTASPDTILNLVHAYDDVNLAPSTSRFAPNGRNGIQCGTE